jgi:hypothetical protein
LLFLHIGPRPIYTDYFGTMIGQHHAAKRSRADSGQFYHPHPVKNRRLQMAVNILRTAHLMSVPAA